MGLVRRAWRPDAGDRRRQPSGLLGCRSETRFCLPLKRTFKMLPFSSALGSAGNRRRSSAWVTDLAKLADTYLRWDAPFASTTDPLIMGRASRASHTAIDAISPEVATRPKGLSARS